MKLRSRSLQRPRSFKAQAGVMLLEALIGSVIFAIGVLALIRLQAEAVRQLTESKMRTDASYLADKVLGDLAGQDVQGGAVAASTAVTAYQGTYTATSTTATGAATVYGSWQNAMARTLPAATLIVTIDSTADPLNVSNQIRAATVTVRWTVSSGAPHSFSQIARLVD